MCAAPVRFARPACRDSRGVKQIDLALNLKEKPGHSIRFIATQVAIPALHAGLLDWHPRYTE